MGDSAIVKRPVRLSRRSCLLSLVGMGALVSVAQVSGHGVRSAQAMGRMLPTPSEETMTNGNSEEGNSGEGLSRSSGVDGGSPPQDGDGDFSAGERPRSARQIARDNMRLGDMVGKKLRVAHSDRPITMDFSEDRLTVVVDDSGKIVRIYVG